MLLLETWVPQMVASRLSVLHQLHSVMMHNFMGSLWQRMRPYYRNCDRHWLRPPRLFAWGGFWQTVS